MFVGLPEPSILLSSRAGAPLKPILLEWGFPSPRHIGSWDATTLNVLSSRAEEADSQVESTSAVEGSRISSHPATARRGIRGTIDESEPSPAEWPTLNGIGYVTLALGFLIGRQDVRWAA